ELTVSPAWRTTHTTETEYVVLGTNYWTAKEPVYSLVKSVTVAGDWVYICSGNSYAIYRYREYNNGGTWAQTIAEETLRADGLEVLPDATSHRKLVFGYNNNHALGPVYWRMYHPPAWGSLYRPLGDILATNIPWNDKSITNVTQSVGEHGTKVT